MRLSFIQASVAYSDLVLLLFSDAGFCEPGDTKLGNALLLNCLDDNDFDNYLIFFNFALWSS